MQDDPLGRALDTLYGHDGTALDASLSAQAARRLGLESRFGHLDSTRFPVDGESNRAEEPDAKAIPITKGYRRDRGPELNQVRLALMSEPQAGLPLFMKPLESTYAGIVQRGRLVDAEPAPKRALTPVNRQVLKASEPEAKAFQALGRPHFACRPDAEQALNALQATLQFTLVEPGRFEQVPYYEQWGRPAASPRPAGGRFRLSGAVATALAPRQARLDRKSRFILATNELKAEKLPPLEWLAAYKGQSGVERGFRFLKDPLFLASSLFLKSPQRIMALLMVMTSCLLVYSALEYRLPQARGIPQETLAGQKGKPTSTPAARWVFQCFVGIHVLIVDNTERRVLNLQDSPQRLLALLGAPYEAVYS